MRDKINRVQSTLFFRHWQTGTLQIGLLLCALFLAGCSVGVSSTNQLPSDIVVDSQPTEPAVDSSVSEPTVEAENSAEPDFTGFDACSVLEAAIKATYPDLAVVRQERQVSPPVFQGGRFWVAGCQFDDASDPFLFASRLSIYTFATEAEALEKLTSASNNRSSTSTSSTADSTYRPGAFTIDEDVFGVQSRQLNYVVGSSYVELSSGGEEAHFQNEVTTLADAVNTLVGR